MNNKELKSVKIACADIGLLVNENAEKHLIVFSYEKDSDNEQIAKAYDIKDKIVFLFELVNGNWAVEDKNWISIYLDINSLFDLFDDNSKESKLVRKIARKDDIIDLETLLNLQNKIDAKLKKMSKSFEGDEQKIKDARENYHKLGLS